MGLKFGPDNQEVVEQWRGGLLGETGRWGLLFEALSCPSSWLLLVHSVSGPP